MHAMIPRALLVTVALLALLSGCGGGDDDVETGDADGSSPVNDEGTEDVSADGDAPTVTVNLEDKAFSPSYIRAAPGASVTVEIANGSSKEHSFTVDEADVDEEFEPGAGGSVTVEVPDDGELAFYCRYHRRAGMSGAFLVGDAAQTTTPASAPTTAAAEDDTGSGNGY